MSNTPTPEERFAALAAAHGGRFDGRTLPGWAAGLLHDLADGYRRRLRDSAARLTEPQARAVLSSVHVDYVANSRPNALIVQDPRGPLLGIFVGLPLAVLDAACRVLRDPALVRLAPADVALPEPLPDDGAAAMFAFAHRPDAHPGFRPLTAVPDDAGRRRVAAAAFGLAMDFTFEHEMAHLLQGHVEFAGGSGGGPVGLWSERLSLDGRTPAPAWRQPLEVDADATAVRLVLERRLREPDGGGSERADLGGHGQLLRVWLLALDLLIQILDPWPGPFATTAGAGYPHPFTRLLNLIQVTAGAVRRFAPEAQPLLQSALTLAADDSARVARYARLSEGLFEGLRGTKRQRGRRRHAAPANRGTRAGPASCAQRLYNRVAGPVARGRTPARGRTHVPDGIPASPATLCPEARRGVDLTPPRANEYGAAA